MGEPIIIPPRRSLSPGQRIKLFDFRKGLCGICGRRIEAGEPWIDEHMNPREISGDDSWDNRWPVHIGCAKKKTKKDQQIIAKIRRVRKKHLGLKKRSRFPGSKDSRIKIKLDGTRVDRKTGKPIKRGAKA